MLGTEISSAPSGVHRASRASGTRAHTDIVQPAGTDARRGWSNGAASNPAGTATVTEVTPVAGGAVGVEGCADGVGAGWSGVLAAHPASTAVAVSQAPNSLSHSEIGMHLPDQDLGRFDGHQALSTGGCEAHCVTFAQSAGTLEGHLAARHEQV